MALHKLYTSELHIDHEWDTIYSQTRHPRNFPHYRIGVLIEGGADLFGMKSEICEEVREIYRPE